MDAKELQVHQSNRSEILAEALSANLEQSFPRSAFTERIILAPSAAMRQWLKQQLTYLSQQRVSVGLTLLPLMQGIEAIGLKVFDPVESSVKQPTAFLLSIAIEAALRKVIHDEPFFSWEEKKVWEELINLFRQEKSNPRKLDLLIGNLSEELAANFLRYGEYAPELLNKWETETVSSCWQKVLWQKVYRSIPYYRPLAKLLTAEISKDHLKKIEVHLFGFNHISLVMHNFFCRLAEVIPVTYYLLSPCQLFFSDIVSDRERVYLQKEVSKRKVSAAQLMDLELFLRERNPLLANFGMQAKQFAKQLEEVHFKSYEDYRIAARVATYSLWQDFLPIKEEELSESNTLPTLLEAVQADIAVLRPLGEETFSLESLDHSIQIHCCCSPLREVEAAYDIVHNLIARHEKDSNSLEPSQILLLAPDISLYAPFIKAVFEAKESAFAYQLFTSADTFSPYIQLFFDLLTLASSRWSATHIIDIFEKEPFLRKHKFDKETLRQFKQWLTEENITWGYDHSQRLKKLTEAGCQPKTDESQCNSSWKNIFEKLALSFVTDPLDTEKTFLLSGIEATHAENLGNFSARVCQLLTSLWPIENYEQAPLSTWGAYLKKLLEENFLPEKEEKSCHFLLLELFDEICQCESVAQEALFPFSSVRLRLEKALKKRHLHINSSFLHAVRCGSFEQMHGISAKVLICLGMDETSFPKNERRSSLNLLYQKESKAHFFPSASSHDRALFMETLLCARQYFIATYSRYSFDSKEQGSSILLNELCDYLDSAYSLAGKRPSICIAYTHPLNPFDHENFTLLNPWKSASNYWYKIALEAGAKTEKLLPHRFLTHFPALITAEKEEAIVDIELKDLISLARNPLQLYFNKKLGIYLPNKWKKAIKNQDTLFLNPLDNAVLIKNSLKNGLEKTIDEAVTQGTLPLGALKQVAIEQLEKEHIAIKKHLKQLNIELGSLFNVNLCPSCDYNEKLPGNASWRVPPLIVNAENNKKFRIVGTLTDVLPNGILSFIKDDKKQISMAWPQFLVACCLAKREDTIFSSEQKIFLAKSGGAKDIFFEDPHFLLSKFIDYYYQALNTPSPLLPQWLSELVERDPIEFAARRNKELGSPFSFIYNEYLLFGLGEMNRSLPEPSLWTHQWQKTAQEVFGCCLHAWYGVKKHVF